MTEIIDRTDVRAPINIMQDHLQSSGDDPFSNCPWVKVGDLYMSVTMTATKSWKPIAEMLGSANIVVITGRHGTQAGQAVSDRTGEFNSNLVLEKQFFKDDVGTAKGFGGRVTVLDAAQGLTTTSALKGKTKEQLGLGKTVIYGWCHSLFSMMDYSEELHLAPFQQKGYRKDGSAKPNHALVSRALYMSGKSVSTIVGEWYDWV